MRRTSAILVVFFCAVTGCRGTEAQVPYDGLAAAAQQPAQVTPAPAAQTPVAEPIASSSNAPWAIALLSDAPERPPGRKGKVTIVEAKPAPARRAPDAISHDADVHVALEPDRADERAVEVKPAAPKSCNGVVNRRS